MSVERECGSERAGLRCRRDLSYVLSQCDGHVRIVVRWGGEHGRRRLHRVFVIDLLGRLWIEVGAGGL